MEIIRNDSNNKTKIRHLDIGDVFIMQGEMQGEEFLALEFDEDYDLEAFNLRRNKKTCIHRDATVEVKKAKIILENW